MINKKIIISKLKCQASIGIGQKEKSTKQEIEINLTIYLPDSFVIEQDVIENTIDYNKIKQNIEAIIQKKHYNLQETLVEAIGEFCLRTYPAIQKIDVTLSKLEAYDDCIASFSASFISDLSK